MRVIIDRFEGAYVICEKEDKGTININRNTIPLDAKEGDVIVIEDGKILIDKEETEKRKKIVEELIKDMWK